MTGSGPAVVGQAMLASAADEPQEIESRFGRITVNPARAISFPGGLLGMPDRTRFCLSHFPSEKMARFKILQSLDDESLAFITLPVELTNPIIERVDIEQASKDLEIPIDDVAVLFIVTVHRDTGVAQLTINARAPVIMHIGKRTASQYVFSHTKYLIRQPLTM